MENQKYDKDTAKIFGANLNYYMIVQSVSNKELAERAGCTRQSLYLYRSGRSLPRVDLAVRLAEELNIDIQSLFQGAGDCADVESWHFAKAELPPDKKWVVAWCEGGVCEILRYDSSVEMWRSPLPFRCYTKEYVIKWQDAPNEEPEESDNGR